jgi:sporulation protein YlmC with PRC-barrel domain
MEPSFERRTAGDKTRQRNTIRIGADIIGGRVVNRTGEDIGKIEDVVIDGLERQIEYVILAVGGVLGIGDALFPVPWVGLERDEGNGRFVLKTDQDLRNAPSFDRSNWPNFSDLSQRSEIHRHYGAAYNQQDISTQEQNWQDGMSQAQKGEGYAPAEEVGRQVKAAARNVRGSYIADEASENFSDYESDWQRHYQTVFASTANGYETYAPFYEFGFRMAKQKKYQGRSFDDVAPELRTEFETLYPDNVWAKVKDAVRYGWDRVTGKGARSAQT